MAGDLYFPIDEYEGRWARVYEEMERRGFDSLVVWGRSAGTYERYGDIHYLTNFYSTHSGHEQDTKLWTGRGFAAAILTAGEPPELHTDEAETPPSLLATDQVEWHWNVPEGVAEAVNRLGLTGRVGICGTDFLPVKYWRLFEAATPGVEWVEDDQLVERVRQIKSPRELDCYREAGEIVTHGLNALFDGLLTGKPEAEAAAAAASEVIGRGGAYHMIPVSHGDSIQTFCRNPLTGYSLDAPAPGDMVRGWVYGPIWQGYWLDPGRTSVCDPANATAAQKELVEATAGIVESIIEMIKPGVSIMEACRLGDRLTEEAGGAKDQAGEMWPIYGHGIGHFWQFPWIGTDLLDGGEVFEENSVLGIEAFLAQDGVGSAGFEQNLIVTADGAELLTKTPMIFW